MVHSTVDSSWAHFLFTTHLYHALHSCFLCVCAGWRSALTTCWLCGTGTPGCCLTRIFWACLPLPHWHSTPHDLRAFCHAPSGSRCRYYVSFSIAALAFSLFLPAHGSRTHFLCAATTHTLHFSLAHCREGTTIFFCIFRTHFSLPHCCHYLCLAALLYFHFISKSRQVSHLLPPVPPILPTTCAAHAHPPPTPSLPEFTCTFTARCTVVHTTQHTFTTHAGIPPAACCLAPGRARAPSAWVLDPIENLSHTPQQFTALAALAATLTHVLGFCTTPNWVLHHLVQSTTLQFLRYSPSGTLGRVLVFFCARAFGYANLYLHLQFCHRTFQIVL